MSENSRELSTESMNISDERSGEKLPDVLFQTFADPERLSLDSLSYVGDAVYTLFFRLSTLSRAHRRAGVQHDIVSEYVSARGQHRALEILMPLLTKEEKKKKALSEGVTTPGGPRNTGMMKITEWLPRLKPWSVIFI